MAIPQGTDLRMFKRLSHLLSGKPAKKKAPAKRKAATAELEDAAAEMGEAAAAMKRAAAEMNRAVTGTPSPAKPPAGTQAPAQAQAGDDPATAAKVAAETRADLIRQAMAVRRDKAKALEELPVRDQRKLRALAEKMMLGGTEPEPPAPGKKPPRRH